MRDGGSGCRTTCGHGGRKAPELSTKRRWVFRVIEEQNCIQGFSRCDDVRNCGTNNDAGVFKTDKVKDLCV